MYGHHTYQTRRRQQHHRAFKPLHLKTSSTFDPVAIRHVQSSATPKSTEDPLESTWAGDWVRDTSIPGDGNCLFTSVSRIVRDAPPHHKAVIQSHCSSVGLTHVTVDVLASSPDMVRVLSVACVKLYFVSPAVKSAVDTWRTLYAGAAADNDAELLMELAHVACLKDVASPTLAPTHLDTLFATMRCKRSYWGGEFDLMMLQELLGVAFVVVDGESGKVSAVPMAHAPTFRPRLAMTLYRTVVGGQPHYETLERKTEPRGRATFGHGELPGKLAAMCRRDLGASCLPLAV